MTNSRSLVANGLILAAIGLLVAIYFTPIWWVSLTAPNYPEEAFPDGIRIHFHMNGVFNGCEKIEKVDLKGFSQLQVQIRLLHSSLRTFGITVPQITEKLKRLNLDTPLGQLKHKSQDLLLRYKGREKSAEQIRNLVLIASP